MNEDDFWSCSVVALVAAVVAALRRRGDGGRGSARRRPRPAAKKPKLPPLPAEVRARKRWIIGVKCDAPPFGYINVQGRERRVRRRDRALVLAVRIRQGEPRRFVCAPTPAREPLLTTGRVDLVISTFTYTRDRDTRIDFSRAYYKATGRLLVKNDSPISSLSRPGGQDGRDDERLDLRPVGAEVLPEREADRVDNLTNARLDVRPGAGGHADVGRRGARRDRGGGPQLEADERPLPRAARTGSGSSRGTSR